MPITVRFIDPFQIVPVANAVIKVKEDGCSNSILTVASATGSTKMAAVKALHKSLRAPLQCYQRLHANMLISRQLHSLAQEACPRSSSQAGTVRSQNRRSGLNALGRPPGTAPAAAPHGPIAGNGGRRTHAACDNPESTALRCFDAAAGRRDKARRVLARVT